MVSQTASAVSLITPSRVGRATQLSLNSRSLRITLNIEAPRSSEPVKMEPPQIFGKATQDHRMLGMVVMAERRRSVSWCV